MATNPIRNDEGQKDLESLRGRIARIGPKVSPEHRAILGSGLAKVSNTTFNELLASMPDVGLDSDFEPRRD
jgi:antitoxin FitA